MIDWLALYAQDDTGYNNLCALVSAAHLGRPVEQDPHVTLADMAGKTDGLICLTGGGEGALARLLAGEQKMAADDYVEQLEALAAADGGLAGQSLEAQDRYWDLAKAAEKAGRR